MPLTNAPEDDRRVDELRATSRAAARCLNRSPGLVRFLERPPRLDVLRRVPDDDEALARRAVRLLRTRLLVHTAYFEGRGGSPFEAAALWSDFGDEALALADRVAFRALTDRHGLPLDEDGEEVGRAIFGLGKLGARELNPSSDIDILFAYGTDEGGAGELSLHELFSRWATRVREILADVDDDGFAFRVDLDLRPEGTQGTITNSLDALEAYYERFGQTWERAALLRLRPVVSTRGLGAKVVRRLRPFIFPRQSDLVILEVLADMRARIAATAPSEGFDVKRSEGGIRDVEFRVQALQLLYGGRMPRLRSGSTVELLGQLRAAGLLEHRTAVELEDSYALLRQLEHALQYLEDRQTQHLPPEGETRAVVLERLTRSLGMAKSGGFVAHLEQARARVRAAYDEVFAEVGRSAAPEALLALDKTATAEQRADALARLGFADARTALGFVEQLARRRSSPFAPGVQARDERARRVAARLLEHAAKSPRPMHALARLPELFAGPREGLALPTLLSDDRLAGLLVRVLATSPSLSRLLTRRAADVGVLVRGPRPRRVPAFVLLGHMREEGDDEEEALVRMRRVKGRETLRVGLGFLDGRLDVGAAAHRLSAVADAAVARALEVARGRMARRFGEVEGAKIAVLALGRLGGRELGFLSDLDLLFVFEGEGESTGPRTIDVREWAGRLAQQTVWALTVPLAEGACYDVDTRLRPSGTQGPLCVRLQKLVHYHETEAALWERQTLLRLRPVAGDRAFSREVAAAAGQALLRPAPDDVGTQLLDMRQRMIQERTRPQGGFDLKLSDGGLADVEFAVQGAQLRWAAERPGVRCASTPRALARLARRGLIAARDAETLAGGYHLLTTVREAALLVGEQGDAVLDRDDDRLELLARMGGFDLPAGDGEELWARIIDAAVRIREAASRVLLRL